MKFFFDYFPIICFFIAYKISGIYVATGVAMGSVVLQVCAYWIKHRRFEKLHIILLATILVFGSLTFIFHNPIFIKWKPTIVYWLFAIVMLFSPFVGNKKTLFERSLKEKISLPNQVWFKLNLSWAFFFLFLGTLNIAIVYNFNTTTWVYYKFFGTLIMMIIFIIAQAVYISCRVKQHET